MNAYVTMIVFKAAVLHQGACCVLMADVENRHSCSSRRFGSIVAVVTLTGWSLLTGVLLPTGLVSVGPMECSATQSNTVGLCVISEETSKMLMVHRILQDDSYNRQGLYPSC